MNIFNKYPGLRNKKRMNTINQKATSLCKKPFNKIYTLIIISVLTMAIFPAEAGFQLIVSSDYDQYVNGNEYCQSASFFGGIGLPSMGILAAAMTINNFIYGDSKSQYYEASALIPFMLKRKDDGPYTTGSGGIQLYVHSRNFGVGGVSVHDDIRTFLTDANGIGYQGGVEDFGEKMERI